MADTTHTVEIDHNLDDYAEKITAINELWDKHLEKIKAVNTEIGKTGKGVRTSERSEDRQMRNNMAQMQQGQKFTSNLNKLFQGLSGTGGIFNPKTLAGLYGLMYGAAAVGGNRGGGGGGAGAGGPGMLNPLGMVKGLLASTGVIAAVIEAAAAIAFASFKIAERGGARGKFAAGVGGSVGGVSAASIGYDRWQSNTEGTLGGIAKGMTDFTSPEYLTLKLAGLTKGMTDKTTSDELLGKAQEEFAKESQHWSRDRLGTMAGVRGWDKLFDAPTQLRLWQEAHSEGGMDRLHAATLKSKKDAEGMNLTPEEVRKNQDLEQFGREWATKGETVIERKNAEAIGSVEEGWKKFSEDYLPGIIKAADAAAGGLNWLNKQAQELGVEFRDWLKKYLPNPDSNKPTADAGAVSMLGGQTDSSGWAIPGGGATRSWAGESGPHSRRAGGPVGGDYNITGPAYAGAKPEGAIKDRAMHLMNYLVKKRGWTPEAASIAAGNSEQESGIFWAGKTGDLGTKGDGEVGSDGMFQWNRKRKHDLKLKYGDRWRTQDAQEEYMADEAERMMPDWKKIHSLDNAGSISHRYEGYGDNSTGTRIGNSRKWLRTYREQADTVSKAAGKPEEKKPDASGKTSMNDLNLFQHEKGQHIKVSNTAGANVAIQSVMLGGIKGSFA